MKRRRLDAAKIKPAPKCPECAMALPFATGVAEVKASHGRMTAEPIPEVSTPRAGSLTYCAGCGTLLIFDEKLDLRRPFPWELQQLRKHSPQILLAEAAARMALGRGRS